MLIFLGSLFLLQANGMISDLPGCFWSHQNTAVVSPFWRWII